ncbi:MAG: hypothetical protein IJ770_00165 [Alphaproteobacteria bacterium]|nr:hypothetical protein [Alphaproteobacteria bacterium]
MNKLFVKSVNTRNDAYDVTFGANEKNEVLATVENSAGQLMYKDVGLVDLSGRKTRVPATVHNALNTVRPTQEQRLKIESFQRICVARLGWSIGCFAHL